MSSEVDKNLVDTAPPQDIEAEASMLGAMMMWPDPCIEAVLSANCDAADCYRPEHQEIFRAIVAMDLRTGGACDLNLLCSELEASPVGGLEACGGKDYIVRLANEASLPSTAKYHALRVRECSDLRRLRDTAAEVLRDVLRPGAKSAEIAETLEAGLVAAAGHDRHRSGSMTGAQALAALDAREASPDHGLVETGLIDLDEYLAGGLRPGQMIVVAGKTSYGKTSLALGIARHAALEKNIGVGFFSTEMPADYLAARLIASVGDVDAEDIRWNRLGPDGLKRVTLARASISAAPMHFEDAAGLTIPQFRVKARQLARRHKIGLVVVDYLQQMVSGDRSETRQIEVAKISRAMQQTARELNVPVLVLSQLSRKTNDRLEPRIEDLRASGTIEEDADIVILIGRKASTPGMAKLIIGKHRNGRTGSFPVVWVGSRLTFKNFSPREREAAIDATPPGVEREDVARRLTPHDNPALPF